MKSLAFAVAFLILLAGQVLAAGFGGTVASFTGSIASGTSSITATFDGSSTMNVTAVTGTIPIGSTVSGCSCFFGNTYTVLDQASGTPGGVGAYHISSTAAAQTGASVSGVWNLLTVSAVASGTIDTGHGVYGTSVPTGETINGLASGGNSRFQTCSASNVPCVFALSASATVSSESMTTESCNSNISVTSNLTLHMNGSGIYAGCIADTPKYSGKWYFEVTYQDNLPSGESYGVSNNGVGIPVNRGQSTAPGANAGVDVNSVGFLTATDNVFWANTHTTAVTAPTNGKTGAVAVDLDSDNQQFWYCADVTDTSGFGGGCKWNGNASASPTQAGTGVPNNGTGHILSATEGPWIPTGAWFPFWIGNALNSQATFNLGGSSFVGTVPSGYTSWITAGGEPPTPGPGSAKVINVGGDAPTWAATTAYVSGKRVIAGPGWSGSAYTNGQALCIFAVTTGGTSGSLASAFNTACSSGTPWSGSGGDVPSNSGWPGGASTVSDGSVTWVLLSKIDYPTLSSALFDSATSWASGTQFLFRQVVVDGGWAFYNGTDPGVSPPYTTSGATAPHTVCTLTMGSTCSDGAITWTVLAQIPYTSGSPWPHELSYFDGSYTVQANYDVTIQLWWGGSAQSVIQPGHNNEADPQLVMLHQDLVNDSPVYCPNYTRGTQGAFIAAGTNYYACAGYQNNYIWTITAAPGDSYLDNTTPSVGPTRINSMTGVTLYNNEAWGGVITTFQKDGSPLSLSDSGGIVSRLQIQSTASVCSSGHAQGAGFLHSDLIQFSDDLMECDAGPAAILTDAAALITNNIISSSASTNGYACIQIGYPGVIYNNTCVGSGALNSTFVVSQSQLAGIFLQGSKYSPQPIDQNAFFGFANCLAYQTSIGAPTIRSTHNATDIATCPTSTFTDALGNSDTAVAYPGTTLNGLTPSNELVNATPGASFDGRVKSPSADIYNAGGSVAFNCQCYWGDMLNVSDIYGTARPTSARYDIGAEQYQAPASFTPVGPGRIFPVRAGGSASSCIYNGNNSGSCLASSDTTDTLSATDPVFTSTSVSMGFAASDAIKRNGSTIVGFFAVCPGGVGNSSGYAANWCYQSSYLKACITGGVPTSPPYWDAGFVSWPAAGNIIYNSRADGTSFYNGLPVYSPVYTFDDTSASLSRRGAGKWPALITSVCGSPTYADFINSVAGNMPDLNTALLEMQTGESVEVKAAPSSIPFWPTTDNNIGPVANTSTTVHDITVNLDSGVLLGYGNVSKGVLDAENNGTTINGNGASIYWVQPGGSGGNQACVAWDAGLDLTVENINCNMAPMGLVRGDIRSGITTLLNDTFENNGCQDSACAYGHNHNVYIGTVDTAGLDVVNATNLFDPDVQERGWNFKLRAPNSNLTQSAFLARINNGASSPHGAMDFPCGGVHSVTYSTLETNAFSHSPSGNQSNFLVQADEETTTNTTTVGTGKGTNAGICATRIYLPSGGGISGTITSPTTFTTATDPATIFLYDVFGNGFTYGFVWDLGASGLMVNGPAPILSWTGPSGGLYTVTVGPCFSGEGTLPLAQGVPVYSCFAASSGSVTLYPQAALTVVTNASTTASLSTPVDPRQFGINVGDTIFDNSNNPNTITGITGSGPYTITLSCAADAPTTSTCLNPAAWALNPSESPLPSGVDFVEKGGPIQMTASTTGTGCGVNTLCGIASNPAGWLPAPGMGVYGIDVASGCVLAAQIDSIQPVIGSGTTYSVGDHITLAGGTFETAAVVDVAAVSGGIPTAYTIVSGGVYTALPKTFTQGSTTGSGSGAQLHFPFPAPIIGGSGANWTLTLAQTSGANCVTGSTTNAVYQMLTPTNITFDHDLVIWDGVSPFGGLSSVLAFNGSSASAAPNAYQSSTATNGLYVADSGNSVVWGSSPGDIQLGSTDGGGNVFCNARTDLVTSPRCAIPPFTTASFTGSIASGVMSAPSGASACAPGMYIWDNEGEFNNGSPGYVVGGTRIVSGGPTIFTLSFPPGGVSTTDVASTTLNCGWGTPSSAENATIASNGIMTINSGLVGSIHVGDYLADISATLPTNVQVTSAIDSTHWQTNYSGAGVSAEYMVSVR